MTTTIDTNSASSYAITDTTSADTITIEDGPPENGFQTTEIATASNTFILANKGFIDVDGSGNGDSIILDNPDPAAGLSTFEAQDVGAGSTINGGNSTANSPDIAVYALFLQASGSIGSTRALKTQTSQLYAEAGAGSSGNLNIANGVAAPITLNIGLVLANGGSIVLTNNGSINDYIDGINATGNVAIDALGVTADFNTGSGSGITSSSGSINSLTTGIGEDTNLGDGVGSGSMSATTGITWSTGRNFTINANAKVTNSSSGNISITAGGDFTMLTSPGNLANAPEIVNSAAGGTISLTALGSTGALTVNSTGSTAIQSDNGNITLAADAMVIDKGVNAGTAAIGLTNATAGQAVSLGAANAPGVLGLTQAELNELTGGVVRIGSPTAGNLTIASPITTLSGSSRLTLINNGSISENYLASLTIPALAVDSSGPVTLNNPKNDIGALAASTTGALTVNNGTNTLVVPNAGIDGVLGIDTNNSAVNLTADNMTIQQVINAGSGAGAIVTLAPFTSTLNVTLGTASVAGSTFGLTNGALGWIAASVLRIDAGSGNITITGAINRTPTATAPSRYQTLSLATGGSMSQNAALSVANLALYAIDGITLTGSGNSVDTLAFANASGAVSFTDVGTNGLTINAVDDIASSSNTGTTTTILTGGNLVFDVGLLSNGATTLTSTNGAILDGDSGAIVDVTAPTLALSASTGIGTSGDPLQTQVGSLSASTATGGIFVDNDSAVPGTLNIGVGSGGVEVTGAPGHNAINLLNNGTIDSTINGANIIGPGNITLTAEGAGADINIAGQTAMFSIVSGSGLVLLDAGRDLTLGGSAANSFGAIQAAGPIELVAGRNLTIDPNAYVDILSGTGGITASAGGNFDMSTSPSGLGGAPYFLTTGGTITLSAGPVDTMTLASTGTNAVTSDGGTITLNADDLIVDEGVNAGSGTVAIRTVSTGQLIALGTATGGLQLSNALLNEITAATLSIGRILLAGEVTIAGTVNPTHVTNLTIKTGSGLATDSGSAIDVAGVLTIDFDGAGLGATADLSGATITASAVDVVGGTGNDTIFSGGSGESFTGGGGIDTFAGSSAHLNGDTIADLGDEDKIVIADATIAHFAFHQNGTTLSFDPNTSASSAFDTITLSNDPTGIFVATADSVSGVDLTYIAQPGALSGTGESDALMTNAAGALVLDEISGGQEVYTQIGALGPEWDFEGEGPIAGDGKNQFVLWYGTNDSPTYGSILLGEDDGGAASYTKIGSLGPEWQFEGVGPLAGGSNADILLWYGTNDSPTYGALVVAADQGGSLAYTDIGSLGPEWQFEGVGDYLNNGSSDFLIWDTSSSSSMYGSLVVGQDVSGTAQYTTVGALGPTTWQVEGSGDLLNDGKESFLLWDKNSSDPNYGALVVGEANNGSVSYAGVGSVGPQWDFLGTGDYDGASPAEFLMQNSTTGALLLGTIAGGTTTYTQVGAVSPTTWNFHTNNVATLT